MFLIFPKRKFSKHSKGYPLITFIFCLLLAFPADVRSQAPGILDAESVVPDSIAAEMNQDTVTSDVMTRPQSTLYFYKTLVYLNPVDTITHYIHLQRYFKDQFLEIYAEEKILPASKIYGLRQGSRFYRSASTGNKNYVFALQISSGPMKVFSADRILVAKEIDYIGHDKQSDGTYSNTMLVVDANRQKTEATDKDYFFTLAGPKEPLQVLLADRATAKKLEACKPAVDYLNKFMPRSNYRTYRITTRLFFIASALANLFFYDDIVNTVDPENQEAAQNILKISLVVSGSAFLSTLFLPRAPKLSEPDILKIADLYNDCEKKKSSVK